MKVHKLAMQSGLVPTVALIAACGTAFAGSFGTYSENGKTINLSSGYARPDKSYPERTNVTLCDARIDPVPLNAASDREFALEMQRTESKSDSNCINLQFNADGTLNEVGGDNHAVGRTSVHYLKLELPSWYKVELAHRDAKRIEGSVSSGGKPKTHADIETNLHFALDVAPPPTTKPK